VGLRLPRASEPGDLEVDEGLQLAAHPVPSHPADGSRSRLDLETRLQQCKLPCPSPSMARPRFRTPYFDWGWTIETFRSP